MLKDKAVAPVKASKWMRNPHKNDIFRGIFSLIVIALALVTMQSFKWVAVGDGTYVTEKEDIKMPLDSLVDAQPDVAVYKGITVGVKYTRGTFPFVKRQEGEREIRYYTKNE